MFLERFLPPLIVAAVGEDLANPARNSLSSLGLYGPSYIPAVFTVVRYYFSYVKFLVLDSLDEAFAMFMNGG